MSALILRLFGDLSDWLEMEFPLRAGHLIRVEDPLTEHDYTVGRTARTRPGQGHPDHRRRGTATRKASPRRLGT
jgi:hypothetical protein